MADGMQLTPEAYLAFERRSEERNEYIGGRVVQMPGGTRAQSLIGVNLVMAIGNRLKGGPFQVLGSGMRVKAAATGDYLYPDFLVVVDPQAEDAEDDTLLNPLLVVEVVTSASEARDRGAKFRAYRGMESVQEIVFISPERVQVERYVRQPDGWRATFTERLGDHLMLDCVGCEVPLSEIYHRVVPAVSVATTART